MSRFQPHTVVVSQPILTCPNGDYFFIEMRKHGSRYECAMKMTPNRSGEPVEVVRVEGPTVRETQEECYRQAIEKCPRLPRPPYLKRGRDTVRIEKRDSGLRSRAAGR